jgi:hypothetical protein
LNNVSATLAHTFQAAACSSSSTCIATSFGERLFATGNPAAHTPAWTPAGIGDVASNTCRALDDQDMFDAAARFSCPSARLCVAVDYLGRVATRRPRQSRR